MGRLEQCDGVSTEAERTTDEQYAASECSTVAIFFDVMVALPRHRLRLSRHE
jgi:hypothetical protein